MIRVIPRKKNEARLSVQERNTGILNEDIVRLSHRLSKECAKNEKLQKENTALKAKVIRQRPRVRTKDSPSL